MKLLDIFQLSLENQINFKTIMKLGTFEIQILKLNEKECCDRI